MVADARLFIIWSQAWRVSPASGPGTHPGPAAAADAVAGRTRVVRPCGGRLGLRFPEQSSSTADPGDRKFMVRILQGQRLGQAIDDFNM